MTVRALNDYKAARDRRLGKNDARRIRFERDKARSPTSGAARRWPFELLQNAHDPGPRQGAGTVDLTFAAGDSTLTFCHNGRPFTMDDLAALLSGGSSKKYDSADTTGRFGIGFLVTHVLSPKIKLRGVIDSKPQHERFEIDLDRSGDEAQILDNTKAAEACIQAATSIDSFDGMWTAEFEYPVDNPEAAAVGVHELRRAIPYLYGTCRHLGNVRVEAPGDVAERWELHGTEQHERAGVRVDERRLMCRAGEASTRYRVLRLVPVDAEDVGLIVLLRLVDEGWEFMPVEPGFPRVFSRFPVRASTFLPVNCVIDGSFEVQEERDRIAMKEGDRAKLAAALRLVAEAAQLSLEEDWRKRHWLGRVAKVDSAFSETTSAEELDWWNGQLRSVADQLAMVPLVETPDGPLPAVTETGSEVANFVLPRYSRTVSDDEVPESLTWALARSTTILHPPTRELTADWNALSHGWATLGSAVSRSGLKEMGRRVRGDATRIEELAVRDCPRRWLAQYLDLIGKLPPGHDCSDLLEELLPNQKGDLCSPSDLKRDLDVSDDLKDIAEMGGCAVRCRLLDAELASLGADEGFSSLQAFLAKAIPGTLSEDEVLDECLNHLSQELSDGEKPGEEAATLIEASVRLLAYIWNAKKKEGVGLARRCPLLTREGSIARYTPKKIMAPVTAWNERGRPFADIYVPGRVLADIYHDRSTDTCDLIAALVAWDIAFPDPLIVAPRGEVDDQLLRPLVTGDTDVTGLTLRGETFSQVALLGTEVIQRCEDNWERASLLLGFILTYIAPHDPHWRQHRPVTAKRSGEEVPLTVREALWVAELQRRAWVPMEGEKGVEKVMPSPASLGPLLHDHSEWLIGNDAGIEFLIECFGFDMLDLRLQALPEGVKGDVSDRLAKLVQMGGDNREFYERLVAEAETRRKREEEKERNKRFGLAVQGAIEKYLSDLGLDVDVIDNGYDLDVAVPEDLPLIEAGTHRCSVGPYHVEIKATTSGDVRLTPAQAGVASTDERFVLCVVDLRGCDAARLTEPWTADDVVPLATMVTDLRESISETHSLVEAATLQEIAIRNEKQLRYAVPVCIWGEGVAIRSWVDEIAPSLRESE